jgi:hypothetical protein
LHTDILKKDRLDRLVAHLDNEKEFDRPHRVPSVSADHPKYKENGRYWQGGVWPGTNYMVIKGLTKKGYDEKAYELASDHYNAVFNVWKDTGTFWEYYAPETLEPGFMARKDFVGWTGLPPIAVFIEYILGIQSDYSQKKIIWNVHQLEEHGIERYPFGPEGVVDLKVGRRSKSTEKPVITVRTDIPFELIVNWGNGQTKSFRVESDGTLEI